MTEQSIGELAAGIVGKLAETLRQPIPDGIHLGLSETAYHADSALGSTGLKKLLVDPADYWWDSPLNPAREPEKDTPSKYYGRALHKCVLEGDEAFEATYAPTDHPGNIKAGKQEREAIADQGKLAVSRDDYNRIKATSAFIKTNPHVANAFVGGVPELSVFWTETVDEVPIRLKARIDYLKPLAIVDLKSIRNPLGKPFVKACRDRIAEYGYEISAAHYMDGRSRLASFLSSNAVTIHSDPDHLPLIETAAQNSQFAFVMVFHQAEGAPISHGFKLSPANPMLEVSRFQIQHAKAVYAGMVKKFGTDAAWIDPQPLEELDESTMPAWWQVRQNTGA